MRTSAQWIAEAVSGRLVGNDVGVTGSVVTDSREAQAGSLYVARRGESADGPAFVAGAVARGAVLGAEDRAHTTGAPRRVEATPMVRVRWHGARRVVLVVPSVR